MLKHRFFAVVFLLFLAGNSWGSGSPPTPTFDRSALISVLELQSANYSPDLLTTLDDAVLHLSKRQSKYKSDEQFAEYMYYYVHRKFLRNYEQFSRLDETVLDGKYDCLTGTALYSYFFTELEVPFAVVENNFHIYILAYPGTEKEILIETTDPKNGFVTDNNIIQQLKQDYAKGNYRSEATVKLDFDLDNMLADRELIGLLLYNQSVKNVNEGNLDRALSIAHESLEYYSGERVSKLIQWLQAEKVFASL